MSEDDKPRTAFEIAMERLKRRDAEDGVADELPTEEQKAAITEARSVHAAKVAELEILHKSRMAGVRDPEERAPLEAGYRYELQRLRDELDRKVGKIRQAARD
jgi:hypothetical protein